MRVLFLNDLGFQYGAGIAHARQIQSFLLGGHTVAALAGDDGRIADEVLLTRNDLSVGWRGMRTLPKLFRNSGYSDAELIDGVLMAAAEFYPDLVIVGNLHGAAWPLAVIPAIRRLGCRVVAYVHDLHLVTGRCVYPGHCKAYLSGCDAACPTHGEYPALNPERIYPAWFERRRTFNNREITLATNSEFMRRTIASALPAADVRTVYLGADDQTFIPGDRKAARRALGIRDDKPIVLTGAVNVTEPRKGGHLLPPLVKRLGRRARFLAFGHTTPDPSRIVPLGYRTDPRALALMYRAADIFLGTASEEAFGQTILEAGLSGLPCAAFNVGGVPEIVDHGRTGLLAPVGEVGALGDALESLVRDSQLRRRLGASARMHCASRFSLHEQLRSWESLLAENRLSAEVAA
jgi:glycosyltransferase involved in cell wall biosynthesis